MEVGFGGDWNGKTFKIRDNFYKQFPWQLEGFGTLGKSLGCHWSPVDRMFDPFL